MHIRRSQLFSLQVTHLLVSKICVSAVQVDGLQARKDAVEHDEDRVHEFSMAIFHRIEVITQKLFNETSYPGLLEWGKSHKLRRDQSPLPSPEMAPASPPTTMSALPRVSARRDLEHPDKDLMDQHAMRTGTPGYSKFG